MAIRVALNDAEEGAEWALLKDVRELNAGDRRAIRGAVPLTLAADGRTVVYPGDYDDQMKNVLLARIIKDWNLNRPTPQGDPSVIDELTIDQVDRLYDGCQVHIDFLNNRQIDTSKKGTDPTEA